MISRLKAVVGLLLGLLCACTVAGAQNAHLISCPARERRLYLDVYQFTEPGDWLHRMHHWVNVYCGDGTTPVAALTDGIKNFASQIEYDDSRNLYVSDYTGEFDGDPNPNAFLIYDRYGRLIRRVLVPGYIRAFVTNRRSGENFIFYSPNEHSERIMTVGGNPPHVLGNYRVSPKAGFVFQPELVTSDIILYQDMYGMSIRALNAKTGAMLGMNARNVRAFFIGRYHTVYARAYVPAHYDNPLTRPRGIVRVYDPRNLHLLRSFRIPSRGFRDAGPIATSVDGTIALALGRSRTISIYGPRAKKPTVVIRGISHVDNLVFDSNDSLYVLDSRRSRFGPAGVYVFKAGTARILREYTVGKFQGVGDMAIIPGRR